MVKHNDMLRCEKCGNYRHTGDLCLWLDGFNMHIDTFYSEGKSVFICNNCLIEPLKKWVKYEERDYKCWGLNAQICNSNINYPHGYTTGNIINRHEYKDDIPNYHKDLKNHLKDFTEKLEIYQFGYYGIHKHWVSDNTLVAESYDEDDKIILNLY